MIDGPVSAVACGLLAEPELLNCRNLSLRLANQVAALFIATTAASALVAR
jgi:hypothetical protein